MEQKMIKEQILTLTKEELQNLVLEIADNSSVEQLSVIEDIVSDYLDPDRKAMSKVARIPARLTDALVSEKMRQFEEWLLQIESGDMFLEAEEDGGYYSDYSWDSEWDLCYFDSNNIGQKLEMILDFAKECVYDRRYSEALVLYNRLLDVWVSVQSDNGEFDPLSLEGCRAEEIVSEQNRGRYREVATLLAVVGEIRESMGFSCYWAKIHAEYKAKFPRHSSFQKEIKAMMGN